jgi:hypothetical protein
VPPIERLEGRLADARDALAATTARQNERRFAGGIVRLRWGQLDRDE